MGLDRAIYPHEKINITENQINIFKKCIQNRIKGKPVSRILGFKNFWKMNFKISKATLDPRPDSEVIIETIMKFYPDKSKILRVLDLGSGSGCLGLSILYEYNKSKAFFLDSSLESLKIPKYNALKYKMDKRSEFVCLNWNNEMNSNPPIELDVYFVFILCLFCVYFVFILRAKTQRVFLQSALHSLRSLRLHTYQPTARSISHWWLPTNS